MSDMVPGLSRDVLDLLAAAGAVAAALALLLSIIANWRVGRLRRRVRRAAQRRVAAPALPASEGQVGPYQEADQEADQEALRRVGLVRYDAFPDSAGMLSFSAALLDDAGNGIVISSINGRHEARTYAKHVTGGEASQQLSPEERDAIGRAMAGGPSVLVGADAEGDSRARPEQTLR